MMNYVGFGRLMNKMVLIVLAVGFCSLPQQVCCQSGHSPAKEQDSQESTQVKEYQFSFDWVSQNTKVWEEVLSQYKHKPRVHYLEIGVFEGRSLIWMLENILTHPTSKATCIDIFPRDLEQTFLANLEMSGFAQKTTTIKGYSQTQLRKLPFGSFDIIYIDGSHRAPDVLADAVFCWPLLKQNGVLIFDDYQWMKGNFPPQERPELAINSFVGTYIDYIDTVHTGHQFIVQKTGYADWER
jgi:predicted O-methyltransferase YrrM